MSKLIHTTRSRIEQVKPHLRQARIEELGEPVPYGVHGPIKEFFGLEPEDEAPTTLDHIASAVGG